jgi:hypothetical protein
MLRRAGLLNIAQISGFDRRQASRSVPRAGDVNQAIP